jgi:UDP-N-acetylmuramate-alanine ligase
MIAARFDRFYFVGIGGIGMSAIARLLLQRGFAVAG